MIMHSGQRVLTGSDAVQVNVTNEDVDYPTSEMFYPVPGTYHFHNDGPDRIYISVWNDDRVVAGYPLNPSEKIAIKHVGALWIYCPTASEINPVTYFVLVSNG
jgi:hypothetical protein